MLDICLLLSAPWREKGQSHLNLAHVSNADLFSHICRAGHIKGLSTHSHARLDSPRLSAPCPRDCDCVPFPSLRAHVRTAVVFLASYIPIATRALILVLPFPVIEAGPSSRVSFCPVCIHTHVCNVPECQDALTLLPEPLPLTCVLISAFHCVWLALIKASHSC